MPADNLFYITNGVALSAVLFSLYIAYSMRTVYRLRQAKARVEYEQRQLNAILSSMGEGIVVVDLKVNVLLMNQAAGALLRMAPADGIGKNITSLMNLAVKGERRDLYAILHDFVGTVDIIRAGVGDGYVVTRHDGREFPVSFVVTPFFDNRVVIGAIIVFSDITREVEIDRAKDEFVSFASHQLRTPLGSMRWNIEMFLDGALGRLTKEGKQAFADMHESVQFLIGLVNKLLDISRIEEGRVIDAPAAVDVPDMLNGIIKRVWGEAEQRNVTLHVEKRGGKNFPPVWVDPDRFEDVLSNLISNGIKYNRPGGTVIITLERRDKELMIAISDTGIGIPQEDRSRVFSKFYRASNASDGSVKGTGLGLFMVKLYIEKSHGKISYESELGKGTTFFITMPLFLGTMSAVTAPEKSKR